MNDLCITIIEEHTKRLSKHLAVTQTRRRTITIEDDPPQQPSDQRKTSITRVIKPTKVHFGADKTISTTTVTTTKELLPVSYSDTSAPYTHVKVWTEQDEDKNQLLHIKAYRERRTLPRQHSI